MNEEVTYKIFKKLRKDFEMLYLRNKKKLDFLNIEIFKNQFEQAIYEIKVKNHE